MYLFGYFIFVPCSPKNEPYLLVISMVFFQQANLKFKIGKWANSEIPNKTLK